MKRFIYFLLALVFSACQLDAQLVNNNSMLGDEDSRPWMVIIAGQSNAEVGALYTNVDLTAPYQVVFPAVRYYGTDGGWRQLYYLDQRRYAAPARTGADSLQYANQFYLYPQLAAKLGCSTTKPLYVVSYSVGDTDLAVDWKPTATVGALYTAMTNRVTAAIASVTALHGVPPRIFCFLWDQGEKDGRDATKSTNYLSNLTNLRTNMRTVTGDANLKMYFPLVKLASINAAVNPVNLGGVVNDAKRNLDAGDPLTLTQDCNYFEPDAGAIHFSAAGQLAKNNGQIQDWINAGWLSGTAVTPPSGYTYFNGYNTLEYLPTAWESLITSAGAQFRLKISIWNPPFWGTRTLISKFNGTGNQRAFHWYLNQDQITFNWYGTGAGGVVRGVTWTGLTSIIFDGNTHDLELRYDGTQTGVNRPSLYVDGVLYTTGKNLSSSAGSETNIFASSARVAVGALATGAGALASTAFVGGGWWANLQIQNNSGVNTIDIPDLSTGTDNSGNGYNGTIVNP